MRYNKFSRTRVKRLTKTVFAKMVAQVFYCIFIFLLCCNLVPRACDPWEGNEGSGIIRIRHTENCMSTELRMRCQKQNKLFEIFYCFVYKMMIFSGFWWKC